ncbi:MAG: hypothetical protein IKU28_06650 [Erysipelotrichaceae bacterium]|nr:hypothetical protein [Erysipelotrichaceae bacterium]
MKRIIMLCFVFLMLVGCSSTTPASKESLSILSPTGAPAISLAHIASESQHNLVFVDGSDVLQAAFVNPEPEYDIIVAPTNLGVKLAQSGKSEYRLAAVVTWGNLYVVAKQGTELSETVKFAAFGENAVPGLVFKRIKNQLGVEEITYYNSVTEAQAALLSGHVDAALIAEPAATATIAKGKQNDLQLQIVSDLQALWQTETGFEGYPQASVFVRYTEENIALISDILTQVQNTLMLYSTDTESMKNDIETAGVETLGVPSADYIVKSYERMGLKYRDAKECENELRDFLFLFDIVYDPSIAGQE